MARAYFFVVDQGANWTVRYENRNYGAYASEASAYAQATEWARDQGKNGHDGQVFTRADDGNYRTRWCFARDPYPAEALVTPNPRAP